MKSNIAEDRNFIMNVYDIELTFDECSNAYLPPRGAPHVHKTFAVTNSELLSTEDNICICFCNYFSFLTRNNNILLSCFVGGWLFATAWGDHILTTFDTQSCSSKHTLNSARHCEDVERSRRSRFSRPWFVAHVAITVCNTRCFFQSLSRRVYH